MNLRHLGIIAFFLTAFTAKADVVLRCVTQGDALNDVELIERVNGEPTLKVSYVDETQESWWLMSSLKNIKEGRPDTLIAAKDPNEVSGGGIPNAAMLRIFPGQKTARLAVNNRVFILQCSKPNQ